MRKILISLALLASINPATAQNYQATQGSGTTFGAKSVSSILYPQIVFCDPATPSQCVGVNSSGQMTIANTSFAVTNAGTFATQSTLAAETTKVIGTVNQGTSPWVVSGPIAILDTNNQSTTPLGSNAAFTGSWTDVSAYSSVSVFVLSNQNSAASATTGVVIEFSPDAGTTCCDSFVNSFTTGSSSPNNAQIYATVVRSKYMRIVYTNGASAQGSFALYTSLLPRPMSADVQDMSLPLNQNSHGIAANVMLNAKAGSNPTNLLADVSSRLIVGTTSGGFPIGSLADGSVVTIGAEADAKSTATDTTAVTGMQVWKEISYMEQNPASRAVTNAGTFATQATLQASATTAIGKVDPNTIGSWGLAASTQNGTTPTNGGLVMGQFNTTPTTISTGNISPLQMDNAGNLLVNIKAGAGSGGTAIADNAAFTQGSTNETPMGCYFLNGTYSPITAGHVGVVSCTNVGSVHTTVDNTNANGSATSANSSPVVIANDQAAVAIKAASASIASGAFAAGSFLNATAGDPCMFAPKTNVPFSTGTSGTQLIAGASSKNTYICSLSVIASAAANFSIVSGSGSSVCTGGTPYALIGSTTAANGMAFAANGGLTVGNGQGTVASDLAAAAQAYNVCILINGTANLAGVMTVVQR